VHQCTKEVGDGDCIDFTENATFVAIRSPCHTTGHTMFRLNIRGGKTLLFTGDCFFQGGIGMFFEGTASNMLEIVEDKL